MSEEDTHPIPKLSVIGFSWLDPRFGIILFLLYLQQASCLLVKDSNGGFSLETIEVYVCMCAKSLQ